MVCSDAPGQVGLAGRHLGPKPLEGLEQASVAGLRVHICDPGEQVELTDRVPLHRRSVVDRDVVLPVVPAKPAVAEQPVPTPK